MIKALSGPNLLLGLSARNIELLIAGKPISFSLHELGAGAITHISIFYGLTEEVMRDELLANGVRIKGGEN